MSYTIIIEKNLEEKINKLKKKDKLIYERLVNKIIELADNPHLGKPLRRELKGKWRVHIGSFILIYKFNSEEKTITFLEFEHHDNAYKS